MEPITMFTALKKYAQFSGRASRKEFWLFVLLNLCVGILLNIINAFVDPVGTILLAIWNLAVLIPSLALWVRRLHDIGKSGWMFLLGLIPLVGGIILLIFSLTGSQAGPNQYGNNPYNM